MDDPVCATCGAPLSGEPVPVDGEQLAAHMSARVGRPGRPRRKSLAVAPRAERAIDLPVTGMADRVLDRPDLVGRAAD